MAVLQDDDVGSGQDLVGVCCHSLVGVDKTKGYGLSPPNESLENIPQGLELTVAEKYDVHVPLYVV
jgi:hypothetical protein